MASISTDILGRYAGDAAQEVAGVRGLARRRPTRIAEHEGRVTVELHLRVERGASIPSVARAVQRRVRDYLLRMADLDDVLVDVVVDDIA
jgi:uncharacterized alkaline shock family protein YloU